MMRKDDRCTLDPGLTVLALRGLSDPSAYPFVERHLWRKRAVGLFAALTRLPGRTLRPKRGAGVAVTHPPCPVCGQRVLWTSAFLFESEVLMHARCWPPLRRLLDHVESGQPTFAGERTRLAAP